jgi:hypothetical protein
MRITIQNCNENLVVNLVAKHQIFHSIWDLFKLTRIIKNMKKQLFKQKKIGQ